MKTVAIGQAVVFVDSHRVAHDALVTCVHGRGEWDPSKPLSWQQQESYNWPPAINLVYVTKDENRRDGYGQQTVHESSVCHADTNNAGGMLWKLRE